jgi:hypothetical protein
MQRPRPTVCRRHNNNREPGFLVCAPVRGEESLEIRGDRVNCRPVVFRSGSAVLRHDPPRYRRILQIQRFPSL